MKKQLLPLLLCSIILLLVSSCKRESFLPPNTTISGRLTDSCTGQGLIGSVTVYKPVNNSRLNDDKIKTLTTDEDGFYKIKFHARKNEEYYLTITPPNMNPNNNTGYSSIEPLYHIKRGDNKTYNANLLELSSLKIQYSDVSPYNPATDSLYCVITDAGLHHTFQSFTAYGNRNYWSIVLLTDCLPLKVYLNWDVTKNNITTHHSDSTICTVAHQTLYNLNY